MARWERSIEIAASPDRAWTVLSDVARWPEWTPSVESVANVPATLGVGSTAVVKPRGNPKSIWTVTEWNPDQNFTWTTTVRGAKTIGEHVIEPLGDGHCRVTLAIQVDGLLAAVLKPLLGGRVVGNLEAEAAGLKRRSEST